MNHGEADPEPSPALLTDKDRCHGLQEPSCHRSDLGVLMRPPHKLHVKRHAAEGLGL